MVTKDQHIPSNIRGSGRAVNNVSMMLRGRAAQLGRYFPERYVCARY
jgi:hypothetical protein